MSDEMQMYVGGAIVPEAEAVVSARDAGLLLGAGLFETLRTYGGNPFRLGRHLARLRGSGEGFRVFVRETDDEIAETVARLVRMNHLEDARVRVTATRGPLEGVMEDDVAPPATLIVTVGPMTPYPAELYENGATVVVSEIHVNETDPTSRAKTTGYLPNLLALQEAHRARAVEALRFNSKNRLAEGAMSNVFVVTGGGVKTPPVEDGCLAGVTREAVLELAAEEDIPAEQASLTVYDLLDADEVFLTNSIMEVLPVTNVEARVIGAGKPGPISGRLAEAYAELARRETNA